MEESLSPAAATTAEEAMATSAEGGERGAAPGDSTVSSGDTHQCPAGAPTGREEATATEVEPWAAAVPPVRTEAPPSGLHRNTLNNESNDYKTLSKFCKNYLLVSKSFITSHEIKMC